VINPQDGHILCDPKPAICGLSLIKRADALKFLNERVTTLGSVRRRAQNGRKTGSMNEPSFLIDLGLKKWPEGYWFWRSGLAFAIAAAIAYFLFIR
jgi:hypothetical protein